MFYAIEDAAEEFTNEDREWDDNNLDYQAPKVLVWGRAKKPSPQQRAWDMLWKTIYEHEDVWTWIAQRLSNPEAIRTVRRFFRKWWDPIMVEAMEARGRGLPDDAMMRHLAAGMFAARDEAKKIRLGWSESRKVFMPEIKREDLLAFKPYLPSTVTVSGDAMPRPMPVEFLARCCADLTPSGVLVVSCTYRGRSFQQAIDLKPIAARVKDMLRRYHASVLHGDMREETISGLGSWYRDSVRAAARIAHNKAAKKLWHTIEANHGKIEAGLMLMGPYGQAAAVGMKTGFAVKDMVQKGKKGDPRAKQEIAQVVALAKQGDPSAQQVEKMMKAMNEMMNAKAEKEAQLQAIASQLPQFQSLLVGDEMLVGRWPFGRRKRKGPRVRGATGTRKGWKPSASALPPPAARRGFEEDEGADEGTDEQAEDVSGWLYNRPYRVAAVTPGLALRGLYNLGLAS